MNSLLMLALCSTICSADGEPEKPADYFPPTAVVQIVARYKNNDGTPGPEFKADEGFVFHRGDVEKIHVQGTKLKNCTRDRDACEARERDAVADPPFFDSFEGKLTLTIGGFAVGVGITVGIVAAVCSGGGCGGS